MPRAALLSIHARVEGTRPNAWEDPSLVQVWGPRFSAYVVASADLAVFTLGRLPDDPAGLRRAETTAARVREVLGDRITAYGDAGRALRVNPNSLRYGAPTGTILIRWDGARQPTIRSVPAPALEPSEARLELVRRYLTVLGPGTVEGFTAWAGVRTPRAAATFERLGPELERVRTPVGEAWILAADEESFRAAPDPPAAVRLLPSGDAFFLLQGRERALLVPDADRRTRLWTPRVWPGALLVDGEVAGTWRRTAAAFTIEPWGELSASERAAVEAEADGLPLPGVAGRIEVRWSDDARGG
jgi:hypothetical protein